MSSCFPHRTLLELHYDDVVMTRWEASGNKTKPKRQSQHKVFQFVVQGYRRQLCQRLQLPDKIKGILRTPAHESSWEKIELLRKEVKDKLEGRIDVELETGDDREDLASAIDRNTDIRYCDAIAEGSGLVPPNSRVFVDPDEVKCFHGFASKRGAIADAVRKRPLGSTIPILQHAVESKTPPPMDDETREVLGFGNKGACAAEIAKNWSKGPLTQERYLDKLLVVSQT